MSIKVVFLPYALDNIDKYILLFQSFYTNLYSDTGIWSEKYILEEYQHKSEYLADMLVDTITEKMSVEIVPHEIMIAHLRKAVFTIERRRIEVIYEER